MRGEAGCQARFNVQISCTWPGKSADSNYKLAAGVKLCLFTLAGHLDVSAWKKA